MQVREPLAGEPADLEGPLEALRVVGIDPCRGLRIEPLQLGMQRRPPLARGIAATRQLAKRQFTWMRSEGFAEWLDPQTQALSWNRDVRQRLEALAL